MPPPLIAADLPLALLPVRLETRFVSATGRTDLLIRVYPDDVHVDTHEEELSHDELIWAAQFADAIARAGADQPARLEAWAQLVARTGPERAAWIAREAGDGGARASGEGDTWTRAAETNVMPDRWIARGYREGRLVFDLTGAQIPDRLALGLAPNADVGDVEDDQLPIESDARWLVDFDEAVDKGMALRVPLSPAAASEGLDIVVVVGVKGSLSGSGSADRLRDLIEAHHYTGGAGFVPIGTATNNTSGERSGHRREHDADRSFEIEFGPAPFAAGDESSADLAVRALGVEPRCFAHVEHASLKEQSGPRQMNLSLWPATWGYFLEQMMADSAERFSAEALRQTRAHFVEYVRARGPLPALRFGNQPYGLLPVTLLSAWNPPDAAEADRAIVRVLGALRDSWKRSLDNVPRIGRTEDADRDLIETLAMDATSRSFRARSLLGQRFMTSLWQLWDADLSVIWDRYEAATRALRTAVGVTWTPRLGRAFFGSKDFALAAPLVEHGAGNARPAPNYLEWLRNAAYEEIRDELGLDPKPDTLLYMLLRHSLLVAYARAAHYVQLAGGLTTAAAGFEPELIDPERDGETPTPWSRLSVPIRVGGRQRRLVDVIEEAGATPVREAAEVREVKAALRVLGTYSVDELEALTAETVDLCSHRLDAWITSFATKRLWSIRRQHASGLFLGGFGWIENLRPAPPAELATPPADEQGSPLRVSAANAGFVQAPSVAHAVTAAVLRSGHLSHAANGHSPFAVDLSSTRVRLAIWMLDEVRQGQPLGAVLGYRFERTLHDSGLDRFIQRFRAVAPLVANKVEASRQPAESIAAHNVVDGLALHRRWKKNEISPDMMFAGSTATERADLEAALDSLDALLDAVSDLVIAESVHQAVQGNAMRSGAVLDAIARGDAPPPELDVVRTPRTGAGLTHRVLALFSKDAIDARAWPAPDRSPRAAAEPRLNAWTGRLFGDPSGFVCHGIFKFTRPDGHETSTMPIPVRLVDLALAPLDVVYLAESTGDAERSELEQRVIFHLLQQRPADVPAGATLDLRFDREGLTDETASFGELLEIARAARALITQARAADSRDLAVPNSEVGPAVDVSELARRADEGMRGFERIVADLQSAVDAARPAQLTSVLMRAAAFGLQQAVPAAAGDDPLGRQVLVTQAVAVAKEASGRLASIATLQREHAANVDAAPEQEAVHHAMRLREVFGTGFRVLPLFRPQSGSSVAAAFAAGDRFQGDDQANSLTWLMRVAQSRDGARRLEDVLMYAEAQRTDATFNLHVAQLPYVESDPWLALDFPRQPSSVDDDGRDRNIGGRVSLVAHSLQPLDFSSPLCGLAVDEWVEVIPNKSEISGLSFHYDAPAAQAPNVILLAVPPDSRPSWDADALVNVVLEAFDLLKMRAVDPEALGEVGHFLPALYFGYNAAGDAVTTDLTRLGRRTS